MIFSSKKETAVLFLGDIFIFYVSLFAMLFLRYQEIPSPQILSIHLVPFSLIFIFWVIVFFISGLYERSAILLKNKLPLITLKTQLTNVIFAVLFFYFIPYFTIAPKTNLFIYILISTLFILLWRIKLYSFLNQKEKQNAILIASGPEMKELKEEVGNIENYGINFVSSVDVDEIEGLDFQEEVVNRIYSENIKVVVVDLQNKKVSSVLPNLYNLIFSKVRFIDMHKIYEDTFNRIPLSVVKYSWFLENISTSSRITYDILKRLMDIFVSSVLIVLSLPFYILVLVAIKLEDGGPIFFVQERIAKRNAPVKLIKFRSMSVSDGGKDSVTRVGSFIRKTRIDELPQLWNVLRGELSLVGPRPEIPNLVEKYKSDIPYYNVRHLIKPGLSGWAQIYQDAPPKWQADGDATKIKLSYDLFYIKNRSLILDFKIALKTIKTLLSKSGV